MILHDATIQKRNLFGACAFTLLAGALIVIRDPSFSTEEPLVLIGAALGYLVFATADYRNVLHQIIPGKDLRRSGNDFMAGIIAAVWFTALGPIAIGVALGVLLALLIRTGMNFFSLHRLVGVRSPIAIMEVGGNDQVNAQLFFKPRYTRAMPTPVNGTIVFSKDPAAGVIYSLSNGGTTNTVAATPTATETLTGLSVGTEVLGVRGTDTAGNVFVPRGIEVHVVARQPDSLSLYRLAIRLATQWWLTGLLGNLRVNINSSPPGGLCDEWMDWAADWLIRMNKGDICKIEKCVTDDGKHNYLRITTCEGVVYYLDPWRRPDNPVFSKDEYEARYGAGSGYTHWTKPPARAPGDCQSPLTLHTTYDVLTGGYRQAPPPLFVLGNAVDSAMGRLLQDGRQWCGTGGCTEPGKICIPFFQNVKATLVSRHEVTDATGFIRCYARIRVDASFTCRCGTTLDVQFPQPTP
jgi:hypothetical protein